MLAALTADHLTSNSAILNLSGKRLEPKYEKYQEVNLSGVVTDSSGGAELVRLSPLIPLKLRLKHHMKSAPWSDGYRKELGKISS